MCCLPSIQQKSLTCEAPRPYLSQGSCEDKVSMTLLLSCLFLYCGGGQDQSVCPGGTLENCPFYSPLVLLLDLAPDMR